MSQTAEPDAGTRQRCGSKGSTATRETLRLWPQIVDWVACPRGRDDEAAMTTRRQIVPSDVPDRVGCASLVDAMGRVHGHRAHMLSPVSPAPRRLFGPVATVAYLPYRDDLPQTELGSGALFHQAVGESSAGTVLVLSSGGYPEASHGRGTKLSRRQNSEAAGVLAMGGCATSSSSANTPL